MSESFNRQLLLRLLGQKGKKEKKVRKGVTHPIIRLDEHPTTIFPLEIKKNCEKIKQFLFLFLFLFFFGLGQASIRI